MEIAQNKRPAALADFDHAILADPSFVASYLDRAGYYSLTGDPASALNDLQQARLAAPNNAQVLASLALAYVDNGQATQALAQVKAALAIDPGLALAYFARGRVEYAQAAYAAADKDLSQSYRYVLALDSPLPAQYKAAVLEAAALGKAADGDDSTALALLSQAIGLDATNPSLYLARGALYLRASRFQSASVDYGLAVTQLEKTAPRSSALIGALVGLGQSQLALSLAKDAVTSFQAAVKLAPDNAAANLGLGQAALGAGQTDEAIAALTATLSLSTTASNKAQALFWRAQAYQAAGQLEAEVADLIAYRAVSNAADPLAATVVAQLTAIGPLPTGTPTVTATPSATLPRTAAPSATRTPPITATASATRTPPKTAVASATRTPPLTATASATRTRTPSAVPTHTVSPTATATR